MRSRIVAGGVAVVALSLTGAATPRTSVRSAGDASVPSAITVGAYDSCALFSGGTIKCWGYNSHGQLGDGTTKDSSTAVAVKGITSARAVGAGNGSTCALLAGGTIDCWGDNSYGELGNGAAPGSGPPHSSTPVAASGISSAKAVSAGGRDTCAVLSGGTIDCWGANANGQLRNGTTAPSTSSTPVAVSGISNAKAVSTGDFGSCALLSGGTVTCWGIPTGPTNGLATRTGRSP